MEREAARFHYLLGAERCEKMKLLMRAKYIECSCLVNELTLYTGVGMVFVNQRRKIAAGAKNSGRKAGCCTHL